MYASKATLAWSDPRYSCSMVFGSSIGTASNYSGMSIVGTRTSGATKKSLSIGINGVASSSTIAEIYPTLIYGEGYLATAAL
jgi:hypothetical protein